MIELFVILQPLSITLKTSIKESRINILKNNSISYQLKNNKIIVK
jgi:hypothetical protein